MRGADAARDRRDQPLAGERLVEGRRQARAVEGDRRLAAHGLHQAQFLGREGPAVAGRRGHQDADHALVDHQRDERRALRPGGPGERLADEHGGLDVEDCNRRGLEVRAGDPGRLVAEADPHLRPPADVAAGRAGDEPARLEAVVVDQRQRRELDAEERHDLVEQRAPGDLRLLRPRQRGGQARDRVQLAVAERDELLRLARARDTQEDAAALVPARQKDDRRDDRDQAGREGRPDLPAERRTVVQDEAADDRRRNRDPGEDRRQGEIAERDAAPLPPEHGHERGEHEQVRARQHEQRDCVEVDSLVLGCHWALLILGFADAGANRTACEERVLQSFTVRLGKMGRSAYWLVQGGGLPSLVLGDASRVALYLALRPAASNGEKPVTTTPRVTGSSSHSSESWGNPWFPHDPPPCERSLASDVSGAAGWPVDATGWS